MKSKPIETRTLQLASPLIANANEALKNPEIGIYEAKPIEGEPIRGGIVVIQEIFGVNSHIRSVADQYARDGFIAWAPAYFDHQERGVELSYDPRSFVKGREFVANLGWDQALEDTRRACVALKHVLPHTSKRIATIGFCWGGSLAWLTACRLETDSTIVDAAVSYYGRATHEFRNEMPNIPVIMHYGRHDGSIPMQNVIEFQSAQPTVPVYIYEAGHGFNCDARADFNAEEAAKAHHRTMTFLTEHGFK